MMNIDYLSVLNDILTDVSSIKNTGKIATYIPELGNIDPNKLGIHLMTAEGNHVGVGHSGERFSIQSISKILSLALALSLVGEELWSRVGVEPSGSAFNSLVQLEYEQGIPRNPCINAGAIVVCDILVSSTQNPKQALLDFIERIVGKTDIGYNNKVAESEARTGYRNHALVNFMKSFGNIHNDIDEVLDVYFHLCALEMSCNELAQSFSFLMADGVSPITQQCIVSARQSKRINSIMQMCGFYDEAGEFAFRTGLPGKSGVGGGIVAIHPDKFSIAVWSPKLNAKGNSFIGMKVLEYFTNKTKLSIF